MWRCFQDGGGIQLGRVICSTHVEMFLSLVSYFLGNIDLLHACGDVSGAHEVLGSVMVSASRMWRCFLWNAGGRAGQGICSTHVEMFLPSIASSHPRIDLLHACGDVSPSPWRLVATRLSAPRMWRCFQRDDVKQRDREICSTHVEMFLTLSASTGGAVIESAPRMWRCFQDGGGIQLGRVICSTHVEMFPRRNVRPRQDSDLLHACGDVSKSIVEIVQGIRSAPRMWRCFNTGPWRSPRGGICSTHVEMFPSVRHRMSSRMESAPRMWRCFQPSAGAYEQGLICSTHVEMFLGLTDRSREGCNLLHACGDVSLDRRWTYFFVRSAPRMWRCFYRSADLVAHLVICSTHVEMFQRAEVDIKLERNLLHACGDVSCTISRKRDSTGSAPRMWRCFYSEARKRADKTICSTHVEMFPVCCRFF